MHLAGVPAVCSMIICEQQVKDVASKKEERPQRVRTMRRFIETLEETFYSGLQLPLRLSSAFRTARMQSAVGHAGLDIIHPRL